MLNSSEDIKFVRVIQPNVDINALGNKSYAILDGPSESTYQQQISTSFSNNSISINLDPPNDRTYISRRPILQATFEITFRGTSGGVGIPLLQAPGLRHAPGVLVGTTYADAPRAYPLMNATSSLTIKMGDATISQNVSNLYRNFNHFHNFNQNRTTYESMTPSQLDPSFEYSNTFGTIKSPFLGAYDVNTGVDCPRGGFVDCVITRNDATGTPADIATVQMTVREAILLSPFLSDGSDAQDSVSFIGLSTMSLILSLGGRGNGPLAGLFGALWSHDAVNSPSTLTSGSVNVLGAQCLSRHSTPDPTQILNPAEGYSYSYHDPQNYQTSSLTPINPGETQTIVMNNVQLASVINLAYFSICEADNYFDATKTDTFLVIENVSILFDNRASLLANMSQIDLWTMSVNNGSTQSWRDFSYDQGSLVCAAWGSDVALGATLAPGTQGNFSMSAKITFRNQTNRVIQGTTLNALLVQEGVLTISQNRVFRTVGPIGRADVLASKTGPVAPFVRPRNIYGSGFLDTLKKMFGKLAPVLRMGLNVAQHVAPAFAPQFSPALQVASDALKLTGHGLVGGRRRKTRGGEMITKSQLLELMD